MFTPSWSRNPAALNTLVFHELGGKGMLPDQGIAISSSEEAAPKAVVGLPIPCLRAWEKGGQGS